MNETNILIFPSIYFKNFKNVEDVKNILENRENTKNELLRNYSFSFLHELYEKEKINIKNQNYKLVSSVIKYDDLILKILDKHKLKSVVLIDFVLYNKTNIFLENDFNNNEIIFILKSFSLLKFLSTKNLSHYNFQIFELNSNDSYVKKQIKLRILQEEIKKLNLESEIFLLSDGIFSLDRKKIDYLLMKTKFCD